MKIKKSCVWEVLVCDFCELDASPSEMRVLYVCPICGKDVCNYCGARVVLQGEGKETMCCKTHLPKEVL